MPALFNLTRWSVVQWIHRANQDGVNATGDRDRQGRPSRFDEGMMARHNEIISNSPRGYGIPLISCLVTCILLGLFLLVHSPVLGASSTMSAEELNLRVQGIFRKGPYARKRGDEAPVLKCATPIIRYAVRHKELLWLENRFILYRPAFGGATELAYNSLGGNFRIHYTESGTDAVSGSDGNPLTIPWFVTDLAYYFEYARLVEVGDDYMKYLPPAPDGLAGGGTNLFDVYIMNIDYYGYTTIEGDRAYIVVDNTLTGPGFGTNNDPEGSQKGNMKVTAAHLFFHAIQYEYSEWEDSGEWWEENTAMWMEDEVYDQVDDYLRYLPDRLDNLHLPLDDSGIDIMNGGVIWAQFLAVSYGDDVIRHIFERIFNDAATAKTAIEYILTDRGSGWGEAMSRFCLKNLTLDYEEGVNYLLRHPSADFFPDVIPTTVSATQIEAGYASGALNVSHLAAHYIMIEAGAQEEDLSISLTPQSTTTPVTLFVADMNATGDVSLDLNTLQVWPHIGVEHTLDGFGGAYKRAFLIVINPDPVSNTCAYTWTAGFIPTELSAPSILSPLSGTILVFEQDSPPFTVTLSVANVPPVDPNAPKGYAFEVYRYPGFDLAGSQVIQEDPNGITSFQTSLSEADTFYFWRCRAQYADPNKVSPWTPLACFYPLTISTEPTDVSFPDPNDKLIEVADANSPILSASLQIDQLLDPNDECFIARVLDPPPAMGEVIPVGSWVFFGPDRDTPAGTATIRLAYTQQALDAAGVTDPNGMADPNRLGIYYYNLNNPYLSMPMTRVASLHDANTQTLQGDVAHLSLFVVGYSTETSPDPNDQNTDREPRYINLELDAGWSLISIPVMPENASVSSLFPEAVAIYGYEKGIGYKRIKRDENIEAGKGYWIFLNQGKSYTLFGTPFYNYNLSINEAGWFIIGGCTLDSKLSSSNCIIGVTYKYEKENGYKRILEYENLRPGKGYWIFISNVMDQAKLTAETIGTK